MRQRIVVGVSGSLGSLTALHQAASEARERGAELRAVLAWQLPGGGLGSRTTLGADTFRECRAVAREELCAALDLAFAARRPGVTLSGYTVRGEPGAVLVDAVRSADDLLVVGTGLRGRWFSGLRAPVLPDTRAVPRTRCPSQSPRSRTRRGTPHGVAPAAHGAGAGAGTVSATGLLAYAANREWAGSARSAPGVVALLPLLLGADAAGGQTSPCPSSALDRPRPAPALRTPAESGTRRAWPAHD